MSHIGTLGAIYAGQTRPAWVVTVLKADREPLVLTGASFAGALFNIQSRRIVALTTGNYAIDDAANGKFSYAPATAEVSEPGRYEFRTEITISGQQYMIAIPLEIRPWTIS